MGSDSRSSSVASDDKADRPDRKRKHSFGDSVDEKRVRPATVKVALVSNIPYETPWQDLKDIFRKFVGDGVVNVELFTDERGRSKGLSLVTFRSREITTRAIEKVNGYELKNRFLVVREYTDEERRRRERLEQKLDPKHRVITALNHVLPSEESFRERRDLIDSRDRHLIERERDIISRERETLSRDAMAKAELASLVTRILNTDVSQLKAMGVHESVIETVRSGNLSNTIFVANLAFHVKPFEVKEIFSLVGYVVRVKLAEDDKGRSKGYGIVEFETPLEALEAVSRFDNQKLYGRDMRVRMDKYQSTDVGSSSLPQGLEGLGSSLTNLVPSKSARTDYLRPAIADRLDSRDLGHRDSERRGDFDSMRRRSLLNDSLLREQRRSREFDREHLGLRSDRFSSRESVAGSSYSSRADHPASNQVILPYSITWQMLKDRFMEFGHVLFADIPTESGKSKGWGTVRFENARDAQRAILGMDGKIIDGLEIQVTQ